MMISYSGRTPELGALIPHLSTGMTKLLVCGQKGLEHCTIVPESEGRDNRGEGKEGTGRWIYLPAPIPIPEMVSFGMASPTTSTTVAIALLDAIALAVSRVVHQDPGAVFAKNHPGGAIGGVSLVGKGT